jgi:NAD-dependent dihydropyrimidine dehydrogenase PreA subunit
MAGRKMTVVLSQSPGKVPAKRHLEEEIAAALLLEPDIDVSIIPHLYDLPAEDTGLLFLRGVSTDLIVLGWLYPRASRWVLDRQNIKGRVGVSKFDLDDEESEEDEDEDTPAVEDRGIGAADVPNRSIYCLDLRKHAEAAKYVDEIKRIVRESKTAIVGIGIDGPAIKPPPSTAPRPAPLLNVLTGATTIPTAAVSQNGFVFDGRSSENPGRRRWYPVIDYTRCTNCMECIDFCLFGVYGVDGYDRILVEQQDNCKKGCPACSRVCPENAIIFPEYKTAAIAGAAVGGDTGVKIDLSKLFGGDSANALETAVAERDRELVADGRTAVGMAVGIPKRQTGRQEQPRDELDDLMDGLDNLGL